MANPLKAGSPAHGMKILHISQVYLPYEGGSAKRISRILQEGTSFPGYQQHVLTTYKGVTADLPAHEEIAGIQVYRVHSLKEMPLMARRLKAQHHYDVVHIHNPRPFWFSWPFLRRTASVLELHSLQPLSPLKQRLTILAEKLVDQVAVISQASRDYVAREHGLNPDRISVLANGLDYGLFQAQNSLEILGSVRPAGPPTIGYLGSIYDWQGVFTIVEALPELLRLIPGLRLLLVGDGRDRPALEKRIAELELADHVEMHGFVSSEQVPVFLAKMDLFTMLRPATRATTLTLPMKIFEVGLAGIPLLVSNLPGLLEAGFENPEDCFFIQDDLSPTAVARSIERILSPANADMRTAKATTYRKQLQGRDISWRSVAEKQREIYDKVLQKSEGRE